MSTAGYCEGLYLFKHSIERYNEGEREGGDVQSGYNRMHGRQNLCKIVCNQKRETNMAVCVQWGVGPHLKFLSMKLSVQICARQGPRKPRTPVAMETHAITKLYK